MPERGRGYVDHLVDLWGHEEQAEVLVQGSHRLSRAAALRMLFQLAQALRCQGAVPGTSVGLFLANRPESVLVQLAVHLIGCRVVFLPPEPGPGELAALVDQAEVRLLVFDPRFEDALQAVLDRGEHDGQLRTPRLYSVGPANHGEDLLEIAARCPAERPPTPAVDDTEVITVFYTGGTSGRPKLAGHGRRVYDGLLTGARGVPRGARCLVATLLTHGSGHLTSVTTLLADGTAIILPHFEAGLALRVLQNERVNGTVLVPPMLYELLDHDPDGAVGLPDLGFVATGGAALSPARLRQAVHRFGPIVAQAYAQSECLGITRFDPAALAAADADRLRSCGRPMPGVQIRVRDEDGRELPTGSVGEVTVRSDTAMLGYYRDPQRTAETIRDGWLYTGDLGYLDHEGYLYLVDRSRDVIVTGRTSDNVYSRLLDDFLVGLPEVRDAAAVAVPDERYGEAVHVFLVVAPHTDPDPDSIRLAVTAELGALYTPRHITFLPALPRTAVGKVDKKALRNTATG